MTIPTSGLFPLSLTVLCFWLPNGVDANFDAGLAMRPAWDHDWLGQTEAFNHAAGAVASVLRIKHGTGQQQQPKEQEEDDPESYSIISERVDSARIVGEATGDKQQHVHETGLNGQNARVDTALQIADDDDIVGSQLDASIANEGSSTDRELVVAAISLVTAAGIFLLAIASLIVYLFRRKNINTIERKRKQQQSEHSQALEKETTAHKEPSPATKSKQQPSAAGANAVGNANVAAKGAAAVSKK